MRPSTETQTNVNYITCKKFRTLSILFRTLYYNIAKVNFLLQNTNKTETTSVKITFYFTLKVLQTNDEKSTNSVKQLIISSSVSLRALSPYRKIRLLEFKVA